MSKKKLVIILSAVAVIIIIGVILGILLLNDEDVPKEIQEDQVNTYTAYVSINPLIKLEFEEKCTITKITNDDGEVQENMACDDPIVTDYVLVNEDAQNIYKDVDFSKTNGVLSEVLDLIAQTARDNNVVFDTVDVYSDYSTINEYINQHQEVTTNWTFSINIVNKEDIEDVGSDLEGEVKNFTVTFNSNGGSQVASQSIIEGGKVTVPTNPTRNGYTFVEWQLDGQKYDFDNVIVDNIELKAIWKKNSTSVDVEPELEPTPEPTPNPQPEPIPEPTPEPEPEDPNDDNPPVFEEKELGSYIIPERPAVCEHWSEEVDGEIVTGTSLIESEVNKYVDMWIDYYGYFYTDPSGILYIAEGLRLEFDYNGRVYVTDELCNPYYAAPLYQGSTNEYIRNYVNYFNIGWDQDGNDTSKVTPEHGYKIKCTKTTCWYY